MSDNGTSDGQSRASGQSMPFQVGGTEQRFGGIDNHIAKGGGGKDVCAADACHGRPHSFS